MRTFEQDEPHELRVKENATKITLIDHMIAKKFKYCDNSLFHIIYINYINNHQEIIGRLMYDAFSQYFDKELTMNIDHKVINMIRMASFTPAMYDFLEEFYSLFLFGKED
jgi:hypothetical protein